MVTIICRNNEHFYMEYCNVYRDFFTINVPSYSKTAANNNNPNKLFSSWQTKSSAALHLFLYEQETMINLSFLVSVRKHVEHTKRSASINDKFV